MCVWFWYGITRSYGTAILSLLWHNNHAPLLWYNTLACQAYAVAAAGFAAAGDAPNAVRGRTAAPPPPNVNFICGTTNEIYKGACTQHQRPWLPRPSATTTSGNGCLPAGTPRRPRAPSWRR
jgi:hypothetical protein